MPLSGCFTDIEGRALVYQTEKYQLRNGVCIRSQTKLAPLAIQSRLVSMPLSGPFVGIGGRVLVHQTERYQLSNL